MKRKPFNIRENFPLISAVWNDFLVFPLLTVIILVFLSLSANSQKIAVIAPDKTLQSKDLSEKLSTELSSGFSIVDSSHGELLFQSQNFERPFNLSTDDSTRFGAIVGCNFFILIKSETLRRTSFERRRYFESYASIHLVSARTGKLVYWALKKFEENSEWESKEKLFDSLESVSQDIALQIADVENKETVRDYSNVRELNENGDETGAGFRPPLPYRRMKPEYTATASLYDILATVDIVVGVDAEGNVTDAQILRWAGYGLDESVIATVKKMKWRPADQNGKTMAMRVLLRYNFKNIETDQ